MKDTITNTIELKQIDFDDEKTFFRDFEINPKADKKSNYWLFGQSSYNLTDAFIKYHRTIIPALDTVIDENVNHFIIRYLSSIEALSSNDSMSDEQRIKTSYEANGISEHHSYSLISYALLMQCIMEFFPICFSPIMKVVSLGSGVGLFEMFLSILLTEKHIQHNIACVDISESSCFIGQRLREKIDMFSGLNSTITTINADMNNSGLPNNCADLVLAMQSIMWSTNWQYTASEYKRLINPDGTRKLLIAMPVQGAISNNHPVSDISIVKLLDYLELIGFAIEYIRILYAGEGNGHRGGTNRFMRFFVSAELSENSKVKWREAVNQNDLLNQFPLELVSIL